MRRRQLLLTTCLLSLALVAGACSGDDDSAESDTGPADATTATTLAPAQTEADTTTTVPGSEVAVAAEVVQFSTPDGLVLEGTLFGEGPDGIVLAHMRGADRSTWEPFAEVAAADGFRVLTFDFRGYGGSEGEPDQSLDVDLTAAIEQLGAEGVDSVVAIGASMGGTATINVASELDLAGAASLSAPEEFQGLPALDVAADVEEPLLLIVAEDDQPYARAAESISQIAPDNQLETLEGGAHGTNLFSDHPDELTVSLLGFAADPAGSI